MSQTYPQWPETAFPDSLDGFTQYVNILASDGPLIKKYLDAMYAGNQTLANQYLEQIPNYAQKIITAGDLNRLVQALKAIEAFYRNDIEDIIATKQAEWETTINRFSYQGTWASNTTYAMNNIVSYSIQGVKYVFLSVKDNNRGVAPSLTSTQYWHLLTVQGEKGEAGEGFAYVGNWSSTQSYAVDDTVTYNGVIYQALQSNTNIAPSTNYSTWKVIMELDKVTIPIQATKPSGLANGNLWFNTSSTVSGYHYLLALTSPATASDIATGKQAYDQYGNLLIGTKV